MRTNRVPGNLRRALAEVRRAPLTAAAQSKLLVTLRACGVAVVPGALPRSRCAPLAVDLDRQLASPTRPPLGAIHSEGRRVDLPLWPTRPVAESLAALLACVGTSLERYLGAGARLVELSALLCPPGAADQPPHPDAALVPGRGQATLLTVFVPLVDVAMDQGPLEVWPGSHRAGGPPAPSGAPSRRLSVTAGTAILMNASTWHRGTANTSPRPRPVLYASFLSQGAPPEGPTWSLHPTVPPSLALSDILPRQHNTNEEV